MENSAAAWGIVCEIPDEEDEGEEFIVFYDAQLALKVFFEVETQWLYSMDGISGLNYPSVLAVIELCTKKKKDRIRLLQEVSAFERGFLKAIHEKRNKK